MHSIIEDDPKFVDFSKRRDRAAADRDSFMVEATKRRAAYEAACVAALESGGRIPEAPQPASAAEGAHQVAVAQIDRDQCEWIAKKRGEIAAAIEAREEKIVSRAATLAFELEGLVAELQLLAQADAFSFREATTGSQWVEGVELGQRPEMSPAGINVENLLDAAARDRRLLRPPYAGWTFAGQRQAVS